MDDTAVQLCGNDDLVCFSGFLTKHPSDGRILLVTATHAAADGKNRSFAVLLGSGDHLPAGKIIKAVSLDEALVSVPVSEGDITVFDLSRFRFLPGTVLEMPPSGEMKGAALVNYGYIGATVFDPNPLFERNCAYVKLQRDYHNGIKLHEIRCDIPNGFTTGAGTSGSPVLDSRTGQVAGMVSGTFDENSLQRVGIHSFALAELLR